MNDNPRDDRPLPKDYPHQLVASESVEDCECGGSHEEGDVLFGSDRHPDDYPEMDHRQLVESAHDVSVEYRKA